MTREDIIIKVKNYCDNELKAIDKFNYNPNSALTRCYGAVMFVINAFDAYEELGPWWNDEMHLKFREKGAY